MVEMVWVKVTFIVSWNNARWCHCWDAGSAQWPGWNLLRSRVEALNTLNLYKTPCARQKTQSGHPRPMRGATSLHIPCVSAPVSPAGGDTGQGWENVSTQLMSHDTRPTFTRE